MTAAAAAIVCLVLLNGQPVYEGTEIGSCTAKAAEVLFEAGIAGQLVEVQEVAR